MGKMLINLLIDFLLSLVKDKGIKEKEKIEIVEPVIDSIPLIVPVDNNVIVPVEPIKEKEFKPVIIEKFLPKKEYFLETTEKNQIYLHHTVSPSNSIDGDFNWWLTDPSRVGCHFLIDRYGNIFQTVPLDYWIHHLGVSFKGNRVNNKYKTSKWNDYLNKHSIGIELDGAGGLSSKNGMWQSSYKKFIPTEDSIKLPSKFRNYEAFEIYHPTQLESLEKLLVYLLDKYPHIKEQCKQVKDYSNIFDINKEALEGHIGIFTHVSVRSEKSDCFPFPPLINLLNNLYLKLDVVTTNKP